MTHIGDPLGVRLRWIVGERFRIPKTPQLIQPRHGLFGRAALVDFFDADAQDESRLESPCQVMSMN